MDFRIGGPWRVFPDFEGTEETEDTEDCRCGRFEDREKGQTR